MAEGKRKRTKRTIESIQEDSILGSKECNKCGERKPFSEYGNHQHTYDKRKAYCRVCENERVAEYKRKNKGRSTEWAGHLRRKYGLTPETYNKMYEDQGGVCLICGGDSRTMMTGKLFVDHNHETGDVRGLLCHHCNVAIGSMQDNPVLLRKAAEYIEARQTIN